MGLETLRSRFLQSARISTRETERDESTSPLDWAELAAVLPDGAFPRGVVELSSPFALGGVTRVAFSAVRTEQAKAETFCAWLDPFETLYAPGAAWAGVDLTRLFVVRPPVSELGRIAVKLVRSGAFAVTVVDVDDILSDRNASPSSRSSDSRTFGSRTFGRAKRGEKAMHVVVRKLALAAEETTSTVLLITDSKKPHDVPWPVAMRLELERRPYELGVRVAKERFGRIGNQTWLPFDFE
ncbi:MAG: recombinase A [Polyangiaceae bacterium]